MLNYIDLFRKITNTAQKINKEDPEVKTADPSVFERLNKRIDQEPQTEDNDSHVEMFNRMKKHIDEVQYENECDPECETAEPTVFESMQREIEMLKQKVEAQEANQQSGHVSDNWHAPSPIDSMRSNETLEQFAITNSMGGSLGMTVRPQIGGDTYPQRVPEGSKVRIIEYSENKIHLDGNECRFAYIDYNGQQGWIPESYLNFN